MISTLPMLELVDPIWAGLDEAEQMEEKWLEQEESQSKQGGGE